MKRIVILAAALALSSFGGAAQAQQADADDSETRDHAIEYLRVLYAGLSSENVDQDVKNVLMGCIYSNSLRVITEQMDKAIAASGQIDQEDAGQLLGVMAGVCGYKPTTAQQNQGAEVQGR